MTFAALAMAISLSACSSATPSNKPFSEGTTTPSVAPYSSGPSGNKSTTLVIHDFAFHPKDFTIHEGEQIIVKNEDAVTHTFTADNRDFNTGDILPGQIVKITINLPPGSYPYQCLIHPFMTGVLTVVK
ncbi:MAG: cupredoxin domain-containing protein [Actinobacteria bacterium]|nr:cupredoxin domain-containing protein [Actinomycetota bacterium]